MLAGAGVLFGAGIGIGAWVAGPALSPAPSQAAVSMRTTADRPRPPPSATSVKPVPQPRPAEVGVPLPQVSAVVPAPDVPAPDGRAPDGRAPEPLAAAAALPGRSDRQAAADPAWRQFAAVAEPAGDRPIIAIVLDDLGIDKRRGRRAIELPAPVTLAFLPYATELAEQTALARRRGHELLVHIPMRPHGHDSDPGPNVLDIDLGAVEVRARIDWSLQQFDGYVGVNNHMGSRFTESAEGMRLVAEAMRGRGLLFLDSLTSAKSVGEATAHALGVPTTRRDVFLDNTDTAAEVELRLAQTERLARETGSAIAIGHPRDATLNVLEAWIPKARAAGFVLVPLTAVVEARRTADLRQARR